VGEAGCKTPAAMSAFAGSGHASGYALGRNVPEGDLAWATPAQEARTYQAS